MFQIGIAQKTCFLFSQIKSSAIRKRTHLALYKRSNAIPPKLPFSTPTKSPRRKFKRVSTQHQTPGKNTHPTYVATKIYLSSPTNHWINIETEQNKLLEEECQQLGVFRRKLEKYSLLEHFKLLIEQVAKQPFPLDSIAMLLFLDTVNFLDVNQQHA